MVNVIGRLIRSFKLYFLTAPTQVVVSIIFEESRKSSFFCCTYTHLLDYYFGLRAMCGLDAGMLDLFLPSCLISSPYCFLSKVGSLSSR